MRIARVIHVSDKAISRDACDAGTACPLQRRVTDLYAVMEGLRDDGDGVPVFLVVAGGHGSLRARLPGLYRMDAAGEVIVSSSDGVESVGTDLDADPTPYQTLH